MALSHAKRIIPVFPCVIRFYERAMPLEASESACTVCNLHIYISKWHFPPIASVILLLLFRKFQASA
jgi:hypothetical protein